MSAVRDENKLFKSSTLETREKHTHCSNCQHVCDKDEAQMQKVNCKI